MELTNQEEEIARLKDELAEAKLQIERAYLENI